MRIPGRSKPPPSAARVGSYEDLSRTSNPLSCARSAPQSQQQSGALVKFALNGRELLQPLTPRAGIPKSQSQRRKVNELPNTQSSNTPSNPSLTTHAAGPSVATGLGWLGWHRRERERHVGGHSAALFD